MRYALLVTAAFALFACKPATPKAPGVDLETKTLTIGALNDVSGPAATIGKPYALGKSILAQQVSAQGSGILPDGWKVTLVERDHGYNPQKALQAYQEIKDQVLFIGTSFGTPNTLPLRAHLERDLLVAFPASLSSKMAEHRFTPPLGAPYSVEAMRALDWVVDSAGGAAAVKAAIIYQQDDYGTDGLIGWEQAAKHHNVAIVAKETIAPGQKDFAAAITALKTAGATHVLLTTLPSSTGPILGTAAQLQYAPVWIGNTPSWIDGFFNPQVIPSAVFAKFYWVTGLTYWGEPVPGMDKFLAAYEKYGKEQSPPDFYVLTSYTQGLVQLEAFRRALAANEPNRDGFVRALATLSPFDAGGLLQPLDLAKFPYQTGTKTRVLRPLFDKKSWELAAPYADPVALAPAPAVAKP